jgi:DNA-binding response OmpR family regulator
MVEDEKHIAEAVAHVLKANQYIVDLAFDGDEGLFYALSGIYDLIILDVMLPKMNGIQLLKELRQNKVNTPVILLTARGETEDKVMGLDSGADDYLVKPFQTEELLARLRALGRRKNKIIQNDVLAFGDIELDALNLTLRCKEKEVKLTRKEYQLLELLINRKNMVTSKELMIEKIWGYDTEATDNNVEVYISFLRKKLRHLRSNVKIATLRGVGYVIKEKGV